MCVYVCVWVGVCVCGWVWVADMLRVRTSAWVCGCVDMSVCRCVCVCVLRTCMCPTRIEHAFTQDHPQQGNTGRAKRKRRALALGLSVCGRA